LVEKKIDFSKSNIVHKTKSYKKMSKQKFIKKSTSTQCKKDMFLVLDFEANCPEHNSKNHEIIEFPGVLVRDNQIVDTFREFVQLVTHSRVSEFIHKLTGITDNDLVSGYDWSTCLFRFEQWLLHHGVSPQNTTVVTCGDWDLKTMLPIQLETTRTCLSSFLDELFGCWNNVKLTFARCPETPNHSMRDRLLGMDEILKILNIELTGKHHSGIDDCKNIVKICIWLNQHGCCVSNPNVIRMKKFWYDHHLYYRRSKTGIIIKATA